MPRRSDRLPFNVDKLSARDLLAGYGLLMEELRRREIARSANNPVGDVAERLFCDAFGWRRQNNSAIGYDAEDAEGTRYQIKGRRLTRANSSRQLSALRNLDSEPFDVLAAALFDETFDVIRAALIPVAVVRNSAKFQGHTNSSIFLLVDSVWSVSGVRDVTEELRKVANAL
jgi:hypothetical protein